MRKPINIYPDVSIGEKELCRARKRPAIEETMVFIILHLLCGGNEGRIGMRLREDFYGLSKGTISNYIPHVGICIKKSLQDNRKEEIKWPNSGE